MRLSLSWRLGLTFLALSLAVSLSMQFYVSGMPRWLWAGSFILLILALGAGAVASMELPMVTVLFEKRPCGGT